MRHGGWILFALAVTTLLSWLPVSSDPGDRVAYTPRPYHDRLSSATHRKHSTAMRLATYSTNGRMHAADKYKLDIGPLVYGEPSIASLYGLADKGASKLRGKLSTTTDKHTLVEMEKVINHDGPWDEGAGVFTVQKNGGNTYAASLTGYSINIGGEGQTIGVHGRSHTANADGEVWGLWGFAASPWGGGFSQLTGGEFNIQHAYGDSGIYGKNYAEYKAIDDYTGAAFGATIATDSTTGTGSAALRITRNSNGYSPTDGKWRTAILVEPDTVSDWNGVVNEVFRIYGNEGNDGGLGTGPRLMHISGDFTSGINMVNATFQGADPVAIAGGSNNRITAGRLGTFGSTLANAALLNIGGSPVWSADGALAVQIQPTVTISGDLSTAEVHGLVFDPVISSGTNNIKTVNGLYARVDVDNGYSGTIGSVHALRALNPEKLNGSTATITENIGLKIDDLTSGATNYSIFSGTAPSKFGGLVESTSGGFKFPDGQTQAVAIIPGSVPGSIQYNNGSGGITGGPHAILGGVDAGTLTITDLLWTGSFPQTFVKNSVSDTSTDKPPSAAALKSVSDRIPVMTAGSIPFSNGTIFTQDNANLFWDDSANRLVVTNPAGAAARLIRSSTITNTPAAGVAVYHTTSNDMADGFGSLINFVATDSGASDQLLGQIGAVRDGADNSGAIVLRTSVAGTGTDKMRIASNGLQTGSNGWGPPFGHIYLNDIAGFTIPISGTNVWAEVDNASTPTFTSGQLKNVTHTDHYLTAITAGYYQVDYSVSLDTTAAGQEIAATVMVNGTASVTAHSHGTVAAGNAASEVSGVTILNLAANDQVSLAVENHSAAQDIIIHHAQLRLVYLGSP